MVLGTRQKSGKIYLHANFWAIPHLDFYNFIVTNQDTKDTQMISGKEFINQKEWQAASDILTKAIELVQNKGWQQGEVEFTPRVCLATAIERAWQEKQYSLVDFNYAREALSRVLNVARDPEPLPGDQLAVPYWGRHLMEWNDAPGRTEEEVIDALRSASAFANQMEEQSKNGSNVS